MAFDPITLQLAYHVDRSHLGRRRLAERTGLSEMAVRTELHRLRQRGLVALPRAGAQLTAAGQRRLGQLLSPIRAVIRLDLTSLALDRVGAAAHLEAPGTATAWAVRDEAVRAGATGLLLLRRERGAWQFAHDNDEVGRRNPEDARLLDAAFPDAQPSDTLLIAFGPDLRTAGLGLWRAIGYLLTATR